MAHSATGTPVRRDLPPLSQVALEVVRRGAAEDLDPAEGARLIAKDPGLSVKILRVANSSFYGLRRQVTTLEQALVLLGQQNVVSICSTISALGLLAHGQAGGHPRYTPQVLRRHAVMTAALARSAAQEWAGPGLSAADAYMAGLLHDIGELVVAVCYVDRLDRLHAYEAAHPDAGRLEAQRQVLGCDHQTLGGEALERWQLPQPLIYVARHHHEPDAGEEAGPRVLAQLVHAAALASECLVPRIDRLAKADADERLACLAEIDAGVPALRPLVERRLEECLAECLLMEACA